MSNIICSLTSFLNNSAWCPFQNWQNCCVWNAHMLVLVEDSTDFTGKPTKSINNLLDTSVDNCRMGGMSPNQFHTKKKFFLHYQFFLSLSSMTTMQTYEYSNSNEVNQTSTSFDFKWFSFSIYLHLPYIHGMENGEKNTLLMLMKSMKLNYCLKVW